MQAQGKRQLKLQNITQFVSTCNLGVTSACANLELRESSNLGHRIWSRAERRDFDCGTLIILEMHLDHFSRRLHSKPEIRRNIPGPATRIASLD